MMADEAQVMEAPKDTTLMGASSDDFMATYLPLFSGPQLRVRIGSPDHEYTISKAILRKHSQYFAKMFDGPWEEGQVNLLQWDELEGIVSIRSFKLLIQWCYVRKIVVSTAKPSEEIEALVEFARLADFCQVGGTEELVAKRIKALVLNHPAPSGHKYRQVRQADTNTYIITSRAILWASGLPKGHAVRKMLAMTAVEGYMRTTGTAEEHKFLEGNAGHSQLWDRCT